MKTRMDASVMRRWIGVKTPRSKIVYNFEDIVVGNDCNRNFEGNKPSICPFYGAKAVNQLFRYSC